VAESKVQPHKARERMFKRINTAIAVLTKFIRKILT
jgi:hypothetical protein